MAKSKHTAEWKIGIVKKYLAGEGSFASLAAAYSISGNSDESENRKDYEGTAGKVVGTAVKWRAARGNPGAGLRRTWWICYLLYRYDHSRHCRNCYNNRDCCRSHLK